ncbi:SRPBCC domain-containing protein [Agromyces archimandritae]|uniref:SRPBCC domain-containing protein n=1 Tax=Agromyces archimandritae TaxID=2781962 RepID=A0A975FN30_9MICO|nr:SRPBCC domain-containing protein [Agromyces archimandritae]QTX04712.1 SRPBCC domain-containing protein [Agromyces archimandritae]
MARTDRASLLIHADPELLFEALTTPEALLAWLPPAGMHGRFEHVDLREGGSYRLILSYEDAAGAPGKTTDDSDASDVRIVRIVPGRLVEQEIVFDAEDPAFQGTMRMTWTVDPADGGAEVQIEARGVPDGVLARDHAAGLTSSLANLAAYLDRR